MTRTNGRALFLLLCVFSSCGAEEQTASKATRNETASPPSSQPSDLGWRQGRNRALTTDPTLSIGAVGGSPENQFQDVRGAVRLSDGRIVVADRGAQNLRWYDSSGRFLLTAGRRGSGPGEFQGLLSLFSHGDSVVAFDERLQRISVFSAHGVFARSFQIPTRPGKVQGVFDDGSLLLTSVIGHRVEFVEGYRRPIRPAFRLDAEGRISDTLPAFPDGEEILRSITGTGGRSTVISAPPPFGRQTVFAIHGNRFAVGDQNESAVRVSGKDGTLMASVGWDGVDRRVTDETLARHREYQLARAEGADARRQTERWLQAEVYPDSLPAHGRVLFDALGNLWVESYRLRGQGSVPWQVFDEGGSLLGSVLVPERFHLFEVGGDYVLGKWWDELDVEHVQLFGLAESAR